LLGLQSSLARLLNNPALGWNLGPSSASVFPPINVFADKEGNLVLTAEAPGIDPEKLEITLESGRLTLSGERSNQAVSSGSGNGFHRRERRFGRFSRSIQLPQDLDPEKATAKYENGMLTIRVEKAETAKPRRIEIGR
jgi:HSP20 family protein